MAISTTNPWAGGAVVLNQQPYLAFYERQMAKEQAKNDALENYFKDLNKNVTSAGMRSQDIPTLLQKNKDWQNHYIQNKAAILNPKLDNGAAYTKYMNGYQDQLAVTNESKEAQKKAEQLGKLKFNKDSSYIFDDPEITKAIESDALPIGDPNRTPLDINTMVRPPKPIDMKDREAFSKYAVGELKPDEMRGAPMNIGNFQTQTPITYQYSDQNKTTIGQRAADVYDTDRNWRAEAGKIYNEQVLHDPVLHAQLNTIYKKHFGKEIDSPRDAFIAKAILDHDVRNIKYEKGEDVYGREKAMAGIKFGYDEKLKDKGKAQPEDSWITPHLETLKEAAYKTKPLEYKYADGGKVQEYDIPIDPVLGQALSVSGIQPDAFRVDKGGKFRRIFYKRYEEGDTLPAGKHVGDVKMLPENKVTVDETLSRPKLSQEQIELALGKKALTSKDLNKQMAGTTKAQGGTAPTREYIIDGKPYTHKQLSKMYSEDKIKQYLDAGIIK